MLIKYIIIAFSLFATYRATLRLKDKSISKGEFFLWILFWVTVIIATLIPKNMDKLAQFVGVERGADLAIYLSIIIIFYLVFRILVRLERVEKDITKIVQKQAINFKDKELDTEKENL